MGTEHTKHTGTVVVTGGAGFIGSHVVDALVARGNTVWVVDNLATGKAERVHPDAQLVQLDVADAAALAGFAAKHGPFSAWYHLAAQADVRVSVDDPLADARTNVLGTIAVLEAALRDNARVVFVSTGGAIYGGDVIPTPEGTPEEPLSPYGAAKLSAEKYVQMHARLHGGNHTILRLANVYGPRQDPHGEAGVVAIFGGKLLADEGATIYGDGEQTRDYVYVGDVVDAVLAAGNTAPAANVNVYNVGTGIQTTVNQLYTAMAQAAQRTPKATHAPARAGELAASALDATKARRDLDVALATDLTAGLTQTLAWMRSGTIR